MTAYEFGFYVYFIPGGSACEGWLGERLQLVMVWYTEPSTHYRWDGYNRYIWSGGASVTQLIRELCCDTNMFSYVIYDVGTVLQLLRMSSGRFEGSSGDAAIGTCSTDKQSRY